MGVAQSTRLDKYNTSSHDKDQTLKHENSKRKELGTSTQDYPTRKQSFWGTCKLRDFSSTSIEDNFLDRDCPSGLSYGVYIFRS